MRQKELRIALVCYGGVSLAVYMHGVTKELWHLARASRDADAARPGAGGSARVYRRLLDQFVRVVLSEGDFSAPVEQVHLMEVVSAAYQSAREGREIHLGED